MSDISASRRSWSTRRARWSRPTAPPGRRIAVAESCTGGLVSAAITEIPGSSDVFEAGYVTYSNAAKIAELNVSQEVVETFGAVSVATAWAMARGALEASEPMSPWRSPASPARAAARRAKPVGTVVFARAERGADPDEDRRRPEIVRCSEGRAGRAASGGALRARPADAVKRRGALLEGAGHAPQRPVEHLTRQGSRKSAT